MEKWQCFCRERIHLWPGIFSFFGDLLLPPGAWPVSQKEHPTHDDTPHMKVTLGYPLGGWYGGVRRASQARCLLLGGENSSEGDMQQSRKQIQRSGRAGNRDARKEMQELCPGGLCSPCSHLCVWNPLHGGQVVGQAQRVPRKLPLSMSLCPSVVISRHFSWVPSLGPYHMAWSMAHAEQCWGKE